MSERDKLTCFGGAEGVRENEIKRKQRHENRDGKREKGVLQGENEKREGEEFKDMRFKERERERKREKRDLSYTNRAHGPA